MASELYTNYKLLMLGAAGAVQSLPDMDTDTIKVGLVNETTDYAARDVAADTVWDDVATYTLNAGYNGETNQTLANIDLTTDPGDVDNTEDITFPDVSVDGTKVVDDIIHYHATGVITTDTLICIHDAFTPVLPNEGDIVIAYATEGLYGL